MALDLTTPPDEPLRLALHDAAGTFTAFLNPYTGQVLDDSRQQVPLSAIVYKLHTSLFLGRAGNILTTFLGLALVLMALTGIYVYRAAWRNPFRIRPKSRSSRFRLANLHRVTGLWALLFLLMSGITGFWLNHESLLPAEEDPPAAQLPIQSFQDLDQLIRTSIATLPGFHPVSLTFPNDGSDAVTIYGRLPDQPFSFLYGLYASSIQISAQSGTVRAISTPPTQSFAENLGNLTYPVHSADFALGPALLVARSLYALLALAPGILFLTGFLTTHQRKLLRSAATQHPAQTRQERYR